MSEHNKQVVLKFLEAMGRGDADVAAELITDDAIVTSKGFGKLSGTRQHDAILGTMASFKQIVPTGLNCIIQTVTADEERVVVEFEGQSVLTNGKPYNNQYCFVFTMKDGKIKASNEYYCTLLADEAIGPFLMERREDIPWE